MEQEIREMDCRVVEEYYYPDDKDYNYIIRQYGLDGEWFEYEAEVNSGSGIGADYQVFMSDDLDEVRNEAKDWLDTLIEIDFTEESYESEEYEGYTLLVSDKLPVVNILNSDGVLIDAMFKENNSTEDLFLVGQNYVDSLINKENK